MASALCVNGSNVHVAGSFSGTGATFGASTLNSLGFTDLFVARLTDAGNSASILWAQQAGGLGGDDAKATTLTSTGTVYVGGIVSQPAFFGSQTVTGPANSEVGFLASLADPTLTATTPALRLERLVLSPNPAHGRATVRLPAMPGAALATLTLLDALGRTLRTQSVAINAKTELDLTVLAPGLYAVRVQAGSNTATRRLVVE